MALEEAFLISTCFFILTVAVIISTQRYSNNKIMEKMKVVESKNVSLSSIKEKIILDLARQNTDFRKHLENFQNELEYLENAPEITLIPNNTGGIQNDEKNPEIPPKE